MDQAKQANPYDHTSYSIDANPDGNTRYVFSGGPTLLFRGVDAMKDETVTPPAHVAIVQLLNEATPNNGLFDGPVIRSTGDVHYSRLRAAVRTRPGGAEAWDRLGVDTILSSGSSANATNTPSIAAEDSQPAAADSQSSAAESAETETTTLKPDYVQDLAPALVHVGGNHSVVPSGHVVVPEQVSIFRRLADDVAAGDRHFMDLVHAVERVFGRT